jgi:hypothetical protein
MSLENQWYALHDILIQLLSPDLGPQIAARVVRARWEFPEKDDPDKVNDSDCGKALITVKILGVGQHTLNG